MKRFFTRSLVNSRQAEIIQVMGVAMNVNTSSEANTYNRMRLACSRKRGEVKSKRGYLILEQWPDFDTNCSRVGGPRL